jgi:hypothetical protein
MLRRTTAAAGGDRQRATMIGDPGVGIRIARAAGVPTIAFSSGTAGRLWRNCGRTGSSATLSNVPVPTPPFDCPIDPAP